MKTPENRRRSRRNDGTSNRAGAILPIAPGLHASLTAYFADRMQRAEPRIYHGPKAQRGMPPAKLTDEQVLALRKLRYWFGLTEKQIADATGQPVNSFSMLTRWHNRVHLDPGLRPAALPDGLLQQLLGLFSPADRGGA